MSSWIDTKLIFLKMQSRARLWEGIQNFNCILRVSSKKVERVESSGANRRQSNSSSRKLIERRDWISAGKKSPKSETCSLSKLLDPFSLEKESEEEEEEEEAARVATTLQRESANNFINLPSPKAFPLIATDKALSQNFHKDDGPRISSMKIVVHSAIRHRLG